MRKNPIDYVIIQQLLWELKPKTVLEMGAYCGGSALWLADSLKMYDCDSRVHSVDIDLSLIKPKAKGRDDIVFIQGDLKNVETVLPASLLEVC